MYGIQYGTGTSRTDSFYTVAAIAVVAVWSLALSHSIVLRGHFFMGIPPIPVSSLLVRW